MSGDVIAGFNREKCYAVLRRHGLSMDEIDRLILIDDQILRNCIALYRRIRATMRKLPEPQRQTLILYAEENFTYAEVAQIMNTPLSTVRSRLYHAKLNLRQLLNIS